jgi:hypothetical protein
LGCQRVKDCWDFHLNDNDSSNIRDAWVPRDMLGVGPVRSWSLLKVIGLTTGSEDFKIYTMHTVPPYVKTTQSFANNKVQAAPVTLTKFAMNLRISKMNVKQYKACHVDKINKNYTSAAVSLTR